MSAPGYHIGVDENGLGPRLGPMIVTGILARVEPSAQALAGKAPRGALAERLGDSKQFMAHGDIALGEAWARALVARGAGNAGASHDTPLGLVHAVSLDQRDALRSRCPKHVEAQCWGASSEFVASDALVRQVGRDIDSLGRRGVTILGVRSVILCAKRMNEELGAGINKFKVDLHAMERLVLAFREHAGEDVDAVCGKVGGFGRYAAAFGPLGGRLITTLEESRARSAYRVQGVGEISFVRDADASNPFVGMASMVGKYVREILMGNIVNFYRSRDPNLPDASGYHDPVTTRFIEGTAAARRNLGIADECFERRGAKAPLVQ